MITKKEAEDSLLSELLERKAELQETGDTTDRLVVPCSDITEIQRRIERASALPPSAILRVGQRFWRETDPNVN